MFKKKYISSCIRLNCCLFNHDLFFVLQKMKCKSKLKKKIY